MFEFALLPLVVLVVAVIAWLALSGRGERDPASSVDAFHRALDAMQPDEKEPKPGLRRSAKGADVDAEPPGDQPR